MNQVSEIIKNHLESIMLQLPSDRTESERKMYLAGIIDTYENLGILSEEVRGAIYSEYCF